MTTIDLNCDVAEGIGNETELLQFISSCNISCGVHAGDDKTIREVIDLAIQNNVAIGAHPSFDDRANFGRVEVHLPSSELRDLVRNQVLKLKEMIELAGGHLHHVKPHGALYNMAAKSTEISDTVISVIEDINKNLLLFGLAESETEKAANGRVTFIPEGFADRRYQSRNQLMSRGDGGLLKNIGDITTHVMSLLLKHQVEVHDGLFESLTIKTLCVHGDTPGALETVKKIRNLLIKEGIEIKAISK